MYPVAEERSSQVYQVKTRETWMTPYQRYLADEILPLEPIEARKINQEKFEQVHLDRWKVVLKMGSFDVSNPHEA